jgi:hypothetical protein
MPKADNKIQKSYLFFLKKQKEKQGFELKELAQATGWSVSTIKTYLSKKWDDILKKNGSEYQVITMKYSEEEYTKMMSQVNKNSQDPYKPEYDEDVERLIIKAKESALLALDIYNRPATMFKSEGFIVMMIIAWTSLFHAIFAKGKAKYNYVEANGDDIYVDGDLKYWELNACIKHFFLADTNAIRKNLEFMIGLRNKIEHRFAPKIDNHIGGECQALLLNFDELLIKEFGNYYALKDMMVFPLQTSNVRSIGRADVIKKFQGKHYDDIKDYIDVYRQGISDDVFNDPHFSFQVYLIPKTANRKNSSDISIEFVKYDPNNPEEMEAQKQVVAMIKEKIVKTGNPDGLKPGKVAQKVSQALAKDFKPNHHIKAWKFYNAHPKEFEKNFINEWCYSDNVHEDYVFTPEWVNYLIRKLSDQEEYKKVIAYKI